MENTSSSIRGFQILGILLGISLIVSSAVLGVSLYKCRSNTPFVDVKGLAEREVKANLAKWDIRFVVGANELQTLQRKLEKQTGIVVQFLHKEGFTEEEIINQLPTILDRSAERYGDSSVGKMRYIAQMHVTLLSSNVPLVENVVQKAKVLVNQGIALQAERYDSPVMFSFTKLNEIKPQMIKEATINARKAAEQFATDSANKVGKIRHATQGRFSIRDTPIPSIKKVRVITNTRYSLVN